MFINKYLLTHFPGGSDGKASACNAGDLGSIPRLGRSLGEGNGNPLQYSCLEKSHGWRSLVGYCPLGSKESDMTECLTHTTPSLKNNTSSLNACFSQTLLYCHNYTQQKTFFPPWSNFWEGQSNLTVSNYLSLIYDSVTAVCFFALSTFHS